MTSVNYPSPVMVNGYSCQNCSQVDEAKAHIDPQHPNAGPYGVNAKADPSLTAKIGATGKTTDGQSVTFGGALSSLNNASSPGAPTSTATPPTSPLGNRLDLSA
jgi:hypothetical protein